MQFLKVVFASLQAISPLGLVQAARKARGESTDVGSEEELWGKHKDEAAHVVSYL